MNSVLSRTIDTGIGNYEASFVSDYDLYTPGETDAYATTPMMAVRPSFVRADEEELHTSFEAAISERIEDWSERLSHLSNPSLSSIPVSTRCTEPLAPKQPARPFISQKMRQSILLGGFGLMCMVGGFDLMALLMIHIH